MSARTWHSENQHGEKRYERDTANHFGGVERFARNYPRRW